MLAAILSIDKTAQFYTHIQTDSIEYEDEGKLTKCRYEMHC